jgi:surface polysaccharide O-acyltransferase-like enzyme
LLNRVPGGNIRQTTLPGACMTSISDSAAPTEARAAPKAATRNAALDRARTFITMLVLIHHSVIAYTYFGHTDRQSFLGFDGVVTFNDSFFMAAMFFLSGLFVWKSLQRKGVGWFLRDRWWRLGLPFIVCVLIVMPVAYYAVDLRISGQNSFAEFWWKTVTVGPWASGPAWFVWVLLALDVIAAVVYRVAPGCVEAIGRLSLASFTRPGLFFWALLGASIVLYVPAVLYFGASRWFTAGPVAIQASRILLYLLYFFAGVGIGAVRFDGGLLAGDGGLARRWPVWLAATIASFGCIIGLIYIKHSVLPDVNHQPLWWETAYALAFVAFSAAQTFNVLALFLRFGNDGSNMLDPLRDNAYGIYLIHYVPVLWLQYALYDFSLAPVMQLTAILKAVIVFVLTLATSWAATAALRKIPGATHVL